MHITKNGKQKKASEKMKFKQMEACMKKKMSY